ncbi:type II toxin-antitoxin system RelE/ParE family toxin [Rhizobiales bacterium]|uniref:type II toxin-antitoxin system RelE/ParE family toxin n=1 Tax=Hongsoonwoonella zoysiae TaxID=2821844 RepID=UPI0015608977|nr:type II toxin-antitoxin system RelE/ParE family toxin [Hongsoonwoonella zoysiae]
MSSNDRAYRLSASAQFDLEDIWLYTYRNWSVDQAEYYIGQIFDALNLLSGNALIGKSINHIRHGYFRRQCGSHLIFYTVTDEAINVVRILHKRMDVDGNLPL